MTVINARRPLLLLWLSMALSSLFFYPLVVSLNDSPYYLDWSSVNALELLAAWLLISLMIFPVLRYSIGNPHGRVSFLFLLAITTVPFSSAGVHVFRQTRKEALLIGMLDSPVFKVLLAVAGLILLALLMLRSLGGRRKVFNYVCVVALVVFSPLTLPTLFVVGKSFFYENSLQAGPVREDLFVERGGSPEYSIYILLFDEMSYEFLYENGEVREYYPNIMAFSSVSDNFHLARAPGDGTESSVPGILLGVGRLKARVSGNDIYSISEDGRETPIRVTPESLLASAKSSGYRTALFGWYHQYCRIFGGALDECASYSIYNYGGLHRGFSVMNPIYTNFILWPFLKPSGYVKVPVYSSFHKRSVEDAFARGIETVSRDGPSFVFLHFGIPHVPFIFGPQGYNPPPEPYLQNEENYIGQLRYVDRLFGDFVSELKAKGKFEDSAVVLMSDHNYRGIIKRDMWPMIPLVVKRKGQTERRDFEGPSEASSVLMGLVRGMDGYPAPAR